MFDKDSFPKSYWTSRLGRQVWWRFCRGQRPRQPSYPHSEETSKKKRDVPRTGRVSFQQGWKLQTSYSESIHCARASSTGEFNYTMYAKWKQILGDLDLCLYSFFFFFFSCALKVQYDEKLDLLSLHLRLNRLLSGCWGLERSGGWFHGRRWSRCNRRFLRSFSPILVRVITGVGRIVPHLGYLVSQFIHSAITGTEILLINIIKF